MQFDDVAVDERVLAPDVLPRNPGLAPHARVLERVCKIPVHQPRDVLDRLLIWLEKARSRPSISQRRFSIGGSMRAFFAYFCDGCDGGT